MKKSLVVKMDVRTKSIRKLIGLVFLLLFFITFNSCDSQEEGTEELSEWRCGTYNGKTLYTGPQGGCYYYNSNGNKTYVDRSKCNC